MVAFAGLVAPVAADSVKPPFKSVSEDKYGRSLDDGNVIHPKAGLTVELDMVDISRRLGEAPDPGSVAQQLSDFKQLDEGAREGLELTKKLSADVNYATDPENFRALLQPFNACRDVLKRRFLAEYNALNVRFTPLIVSGQNNKVWLTLLTEMFKLSADCVVQIQRELLSKMPTVSVRLQLARDADASRRAGVQFGALPNAADLTLASDLLTKLGWKEGGLKLSVVAQGVVDTTLKDAKGRWETVQTKGQALLDGYQVQLNEIGSAAGDLTALKTALADVQAKWTALEAAGKAITGTTGADAPSLLTSRVADLVSAGKAFADSLTAARTKIPADPAMAPAPVKDALTKLRELVTTAEKDVKELAAQVWTDVLKPALELLNLSAKFDQIGEVIKQAEDGNASFENVDGVIGDMPKMNSYDELRVRVLDAATGKPLGPSFELHVWEPRRWDTILALGYYQKDGRKWAPTPIAGQVFKFYSGKHFSEARMFPGIGFSVLSLDQDGDGQQEVGVGAMLSFFDDHLVGGYGYNTAGKGTYWYAGYRFRL